MISRQRSPMLLQQAALAVAILIFCPVTQGKPVVPNRFERDYQSEQSSRAELGNSSFIFDFAKADTTSGNSSIRVLFVTNNAALGTLPGDGFGQQLVTLGPCTINQPHVHPRGTEIAHVTAGELLFGFLEENKGRYISGSIPTGTTFIIPQGLMHFAHNPSCENAQFLANFPSRDPGTQTIASNFFRLPKNVLRATLGLDDGTIAMVAKAALANKNPSRDPKCLKACGISD